MAGTSTRSHAFLKQVLCRCDDHCELDQVAYIRQALHGDGAHSSAFAEGVCAAMCILVLDDWLNSGYIRKQVVDQFVLDCNDQNSVQHTAQAVVDLATALEGGRWQQLVVQAVSDRTGGMTPSRTDMFRSPTELSDYLVARNDDASVFAAIGGQASDGHAVLFNASANVMFDPNLGYYQADSAANFRPLLDAALGTGGPAGVGYSILSYS